MTTSARKKPAPKKRGSYDFSAANDSVSNKTIRRAAKRNTATARKIAAKAVTAGKKNLDLGIASIARSGNLAQSASQAARNANRSFEIHRSNAEAAAQSYNVASQAAKKTGQEVFNYVNDMFAQNVEAARAALECRNVSEFFELQNELARQNIEAAFERALRISELAIKSATQAMEPINETIAKNTKKASEFSN